MSESSNGETFAWFADVEELVGTIPPDTIVSRTFLKRPGVSVMVFGFAPGQELSEHTSAKTGIMEFIRGRAQLNLGGVPQMAGPGTYVYMDPRLPHTVIAETETVMLLTLIGK